MSADRAIVLQNSTLDGSQAKIGNNRIRTGWLVKQHCALEPGLESILLAGTSKIVSQHNPSMSGLMIRPARPRQVAVVQLAVLVAGDCEMTVGAAARIAALRDL